MDTQLIAIILSIVVNAVVVATGYGALRQTVRNLVERLEKVEKFQQQDHDKIMSLEAQVRDNHRMLPDCLNIFNDIRTTLTTVKTKVDILLNGEKKH